MTSSQLPAGVHIEAPAHADADAVLTHDALAFVADLARTFTPAVHALLAKRKERQKLYDEGQLPDFDLETKAVREGSWTVAPLPSDLLDRRVEITGPVDRKMVINALNSGAHTFMADFEDANSPTWSNCVAGQKNLADAVRGTIEYASPDGAKKYTLNAKTAVLLVRPRGWHLPERHVTVDGAVVPGALFDFGLFFFHNAKALLAKGSGPYFYLPKLEHRDEARLWNLVFLHAQAKLGIPAGTIKATVLIETLPAAFQMNEILYELRQHSAGLNCGRWDYIFSFIKKLASHKDRVLPDRAQVTMDKAFLRAYSLLLIKTCHARGVHAMGGMAAQIPVKDDAARNEAAFNKVRADKLREVTDGHDGTWVAHPALVSVAREVFDAHMKGANQIDRARDDVKIAREDLLAIHEGNRTEEGLRHNVRVGVRYLEAWLRGSGAVPLYDLMEDAATAEISRAQVWQQLAYGASLDDGSALTKERFARIVDEELARVRDEVSPARFDAGRFNEARALFEQMATAARFEEFLTLPAYELLEKSGS